MANRSEVPTPSHAEQAQTTTGVGWVPDAPSSPATDTTPTKKRWGRRVGATLALTGALTGLGATGAAAASADESDPRANIVHVDTVPQRTGLLVTIPEPVRDDVGPYPVRDNEEVLEIAETRLTGAGFDTSGDTPEQIGQIERMKREMAALIDGISGPDINIDQIETGETINLPNDDLTRSYFQALHGDGRPQTDGAVQALRNALNNPRIEGSGEEASAVLAQMATDSEFNDKPPFADAAPSRDPAVPAAPAVPAPTNLNRDGDPGLTDLYAVDAGDTMDTVALRTLEEAVDDPTDKQREVATAVNEAANPQVTDRTRIYDNRTNLNLTEEAVTEVIAEAAEGRGDPELVTAVQDVLDAPNRDVARDEAVDVLQEVGITPARAEDTPPAQPVADTDTTAPQSNDVDLPPAPDVEITVAEIQASGALAPRTLENPGDNLWDRTEEVMATSFGRDPRVPEVNPVNRIEQTINKIINPDLNFRAMPVDADYTGLNDAATLIVGAAATADVQTLEAAGVPKEIREDVQRIQELNHHQSAEGEIHPIDRHVTDIILNWRTGLIPQDIIVQLGDVMVESDQALKQERLALLMNNPVVVEALQGAVVPPGDIDPPLEPGDPGYIAPDIDPPFEPGDPGYVAPDIDPPLEPGDPGYVAPDIDPPFEPGDPGYVEDNNIFPIAATVAGVALLGVAAAGGVLYARNRKRRPRRAGPVASPPAPPLTPEEQHKSEMEAIVGRLISSRPMTKLQEADFVKIPENYGKALPNSYVTYDVEVAKEVLQRVQDAGGNVDADARIREIENRLITDPIPAGKVREYRIAHLANTLATGSISPIGDSYFTVIPDDIDKPTRRPE